MKNNNTKKLAACAVMVALGAVLSMIKVLQMPFGGSITLLSMLPCAMISIMYGLKWGFAASFVESVVQLAFGITMDGILGWGMTGAALATSLGYIVGAGMILGYLGRRRNVVRLCRVKTSRKSMRLTLRNVGYMCRLGLSTFLCEGAREVTQSLCPFYYKGASALRGTARREQPPACGGSRSAGTGSGSVPRRFRRAAAP